MPNELTEAKMYEALGLQAPAPTAEPGGANEQNIAESADGSDNSGSSPSQEDGQEPEKPPMDEKQRRENAARRRQQEQKAAVDAAVQEALKKEREKSDTEWAGFFEKAGMKDTFTGEPIKTKAEYEQWLQKYQTQQIQEQLKKGELTPELLQDLISRNPMVQQAQQLVAQDAAAKQQAQEQAAQARIDSEIAEIAKLNPAIKTVGDLLNMPKFQEFKGYVDKGYSYLDSYRLSHMDEIANARAEQARQQAINNNRGKDHLKAAGRSQGTGAVSVPPEILKQYRLFNPGATDAQIQAHYNKQLKK